MITRIAQNVFVIIFLSVAAVVLSQIRSKHSPVTPQATKTSAQKPTINKFLKKATRSVRRIGSLKATQPISVRSSVTEKNGTIIISGNLGDVLSSLYTQVIEGSAGKDFHSLHWTKLQQDRLPSGVHYTALGDSGKPEMPALVVTCVIPATAKNFHAAILNTDTKSFSNLFLPPAKVESEKRFGRRVYAQRRYSSNAILTDNIEISRTARFRRIRFINVTIPLVHLGSSISTVIAKTKFTVALSFAVDAIPIVNKNDQGDPIFVDSYSAMVANPQDITLFQLSFHQNLNLRNRIQSAGTITFDSSLTGWIDPSAPYIKLTVTRTGLYRASIDELASRSGNNSVRNWQSSVLRLINKGKEVPIWLDTTAGGAINAIEFYGVRNPGFPNEYFNWDTDSNAYWLTTSTKSTSSPLRYTSNVSVVNPASTIAEGTLKLHHERDLEYFGGQSGGDESVTLQNYHWVPGERFIWRTVTKNGSGAIQSITDTFMLPTLPTDTSEKQAQLTVYVHGISTDPVVSITHVCKVVINGKTFSNDVFLDYDSSFVRHPVPLGLLQQGLNTITVTMPDSSSDTWYLDYIEISTPVQLEPSSDTAVATGQWAYTAKVPNSDYSLSLRSVSGAPELFDLKHQLHLPASSNSGSSYLFNLKGSSDSLVFAAATQNSFLHPDEIADMGGKWSSILDTAVGADYIIITHPDFLHAAQNLAKRREIVSGFRTRVITTDEIFNVFGYGSNEPLALRSYLQYAYDYYHGTPPGFVTLFGDGTWDPKFTLPSTAHRSFVPTYGVPSSDYIFTTDERFGSKYADTVVSNMIISRISVESSDEADAAVQKIVEYESAPPADWNRNFLFVLGGSSLFEHAVLTGFALANINDTNYGGIKYPPMLARTQMIERSDYSNYLDGTHIQDIQSAFQRGVSFMYFFGHGATFITDVVLPDVGSLRNQGTYPVILTLSCRTGAFAEPNVITLNESYIRSSNNGIIMAFGTTGFGEIHDDAALSTLVFEFLRGDSLRSRSVPSGAHKITFPIVFTLSKIIESVFQPPKSSFIASQDNSLFEYTILGDAALGYTFCPQPEFHAGSEDVTLTSKSGDVRSIFSVTDSLVKIHAVLRNFGYTTNSPVTVSITDNVNGKAFSVRDTLSHFDTTATIDETLVLDTTMIGSHTLHIYVDSINQFPEIDENDNEAIVPFLVNSNGAVPAYPPEGGKNICDVTKDSVRFLLVVPSNSNVVSVDLQADTTSGFNFPVALGSFVVSSSIFLDVPLSRTLMPNPSGGVLWWRSRTHDKGGKISDWQVSSLSLLQSSAPSSFNYTSVDQLQRTIISHLQADASHGGLFIPQHDTIIYDVEARGLKDTNIIGGEPTSYFFINKKAVYTTSFTSGLDFNGITLVVMTKDGSDKESVYEFNNPGDSAVLIRQLIDSFYTVIKSLPTGRRAVILTNLQPFIPGFTKNDSVKKALQMLGSKNGFDSLWYFYSYALIGQKGLDSGLAKEKITGIGGAGTSLSDTIAVTAAKGIAQLPSTAVATRYGFFSWNTSQIGTNAAVKFRLLGSQKFTGQIDTVAIIDAQSPQPYDLRTINPLQYNKLNVIAELDRDSITLASPILSGLDLQYDYAPEYEIDPSTVSITPNRLAEGYGAVIKYQCANRVCESGTNVPVVLVRSFNGKSDTLTTHTIPIFAGHSSVSFSDSISTFGLLGNVLYTVTVNPNQALNEQLAFNNSASANLSVLRDSLKPRLDLIFDGHHINSGDFVSSKVQINARLFDQNAIRVTDTASIGMMLVRLDPPSTIPIFFKGSFVNDSLTSTFSSLPTGAIQANLLVDPTKPIIAGTYSLTAFASDASGNRADTIETEFVISGKQGVDRVMNYPNPFKDKTSFTFILQSAEQASVKVVVYTIAGRKIRTLYLDPAHQRVGLNAVEWDGRDENGNEIANGTYLYKLVMSGKNDDGSDASDAVLERAVKSR